MLSLIQQNPYLTLLIVATLEGPIATFISAGLAAHHILRIEYVMIITIIGDVVGDCALYMIGKYFHQRGPIRRLIQKLPRKEHLDRSFNRTSWAYMVVGKFTPYLATPTLIFAGVQHMSPVRFVRYSLLISTLVKAVYITLGYLGAVSVQQFQGFLTLRTTIANYLIIGCLCFWGARIFYRYIGTVIKQ